MPGTSLTLFAVFLLLVLAGVKPLGLYMANVFEGRPIWLVRAGAPLERLIYRLCGVDPAREMGWKEYALGLLLFNALGGLAVYLCSAASCGCRSTRRSSPTRRRTLPSTPR